MSKIGDGLETLSAQAPAAAALIGPWLETASDEEVFRVCPRRWAKERDLDDDTAVDYLVRATAAGLLKIGFELNCPGCGLIIDSVERLGDIDNHFHCEMCREGKDLALDDWIQVTFTVHPSVRALRFHEPGGLSLRERVVFLEAGAGVVTKSGEPLRDYLNREIFLIEELEPGACVTRDFEAEEGLLLCCPTSGVPIADVVDAEMSLELCVADDRRLTGLPERLPTGPIKVSVRNEGTKPQAVWMFQSSFYYQFGPPCGYPAARLIHHPTYRELFPSHLACSGGLSIREVTIFFSDIVESTAMYRELGDLRAYEKVREHFAVLAPVIERHSGLWIKDVGDAVMASFLDPTAAAKAAIEALGAVADATGLQLKVGVHSGGCIGVSREHHLDWFGSTVNLAARVQSAAGPGELCLSEDAFEQTRHLFSGYACSSSDVTVRGITEPLTLHRVAVR